MDSTQLSEFQKSPNFQAIVSCQEGGILGIDRHDQLYAINSWLGKKWFSFKQFLCCCRDDSTKIGLLAEKTTIQLKDIIHQMSTVDKVVAVSTAAFVTQAQTLNTAYSSITRLQKGLNHLKTKNLHLSTTIGHLQKAYSIFSENLYVYIQSIPDQEWDVANNSILKNKTQMELLQTLQQIVHQVHTNFPQTGTKVKEQVALKVNLIGQFILKRFESFNQTIKKCVPLHHYQNQIDQEKQNLADLKKRLTHVPDKYIDQSKFEFFQRAFAIPAIVEVELAFAKGKTPELLKSGVSGTYLLPDRNGNPCGIFKPSEQECGLAANPKGHTNVRGGETFGIKPGSSYIREKLAYLLDKNRFANIPLTTIETFTHRNFAVTATSNPKQIGSFQVFQNKCEHLRSAVHPDGWREKLNSFFFHDGSKIPVDQVHALAVFDIRTLNCDRHMSNALVDPSYHLHPIDHGFILPGNANHIRYEWMELPQVKKPFSPTTLTYIEQLDEKSDAELLRHEKIDENAVQRMVIATQMLKMAAKAKMTPWQIADFMKGKHKPGSDFEQIICRRIFKHKERVELVLEEELIKYRLRNNTAVR